jgi:hypothetical protein
MRSTRPAAPAKRSSRFPWRALRLTVLGFILVLTGLGALLSKARTASWNRPLWVAIYPINADASEASTDYIATLGDGAFTPIDDFFAREAARYGIALKGPVETHLYAAVGERPPELRPNAGALTSMWWSLKLRYWAWRVTHARKEATPDVQVFVLYHDPDRNESVPHSLGLEKGMLGVVYAFAARRATAPNDIVIAHELMHTLGATDKYNPATDEPRFPDGYADPERKPLLPQVRAEIMAGRMALSRSDWDMPESLNAVVVGAQSAREIHWQP